MEQTPSTIDAIIGFSIIGFFALFIGILFIISKVRERKEKEYQLYLHKTYPEFYYYWKSFKEMSANYRKLIKMHNQSQAEIIAVRDRLFCYAINSPHYKDNLIKLNALRADHEDTKNRILDQEFILEIEKNTALEYPMPKGRENWFTY